MTVSSMLRGKGRDVITIPPERTIAEAAAILAEKRIGAVMITSTDGRVAGILSERDVVRALAGGGAAALDHEVRRYMTARVEAAREAEPVHAIMERMTAGKFRHMPVVENERLVGIISIGDVVKHRLAEMEHETRAMREYITA